MMLRYVGNCKYIPTKHNQSGFLCARCCNRLTACSCASTTRPDKLDYWENVRRRRDSFDEDDPDKSSGLVSGSICTAIPCAIVSRRSKLDALAKCLRNPRGAKLDPQTCAQDRRIRLGEGVSPKTLNNALGYLRAVYNELRGLGVIDYANSPALVKPLKVQERELSWLTTEQIAELLEQIRSGCNNSHVEIIALICLATGARWSEAEKLKPTGPRPVSHLRQPLHPERREHPHTAENPGSLQPGHDHALCAPSAGSSAGCFGLWAFIFGLADSYG